jgi:hypothetical protein
VLSFSFSLYFWFPPIFPEFCTICLDWINWRVTNGRVNGERDEVSDHDRAGGWGRYGEGSVIRSTHVGYFCSIGFLHQLNIKGCRWWFSTPVKLLKGVDDDFLHRFIVNKWCRCEMIFSTPGLLNKGCGCLASYTSY